MSPPCRSQYENIQNALQRKDWQYLGIFLRNPNAFLRIHINEAQKMFLIVKHEYAYALKLEGGRQKEMVKTGISILDSFFARTAQISFPKEMKGILARPFFLILQPYGKLGKDIGGASGPQGQVLAVKSDLNETSQLQGMEIILHELTHEWYSAWAEKAKVAYTARSDKGETGFHINRHVQGEPVILAEILNEFIAYAAGLHLWFTSPSHAKPVNIIDEIHFRSQEAIVACDSLFTASAFWRKPHLKTVSMIARGISMWRALAQKSIALAQNAPDCPRATQKQVKNLATFDQYLAKKQQFLTQTLSS